MITHSNQLTHNSGIYAGNVRHRRFGDIPHQFNYALYMMGIDLDELPQLTQKSWLFGASWFNPIRFCEDDYVNQDNKKTDELKKNGLQHDPVSLKQRIDLKVQSLGGDWNSENRVMMLAQCRCLGLYFSPVNFYFCYDQQDQCQWMLAEVSNTPWRERHYYLVNPNEPTITKKAFHVSPFMTLNMDYHWKVAAPDSHTLIHIENHKQDDGERQQNNKSKIFDATLALKKQPFTAGQLLKTVASTPTMTLKVVAGIYWQALKLFIKKVPFVGHPDTK